MPLLEVATFSASNALKAQSLGASRIELNAPSSYPQGGLTPPASELILLTSQTLKIPLRVMIRPRGPPQHGPDFIYTAREFELMREAILQIKSLDVLDPERGDGFVFGILKRGEAEALVIDEDACRVLIEIAHPLPCVFHRAFDPIAATDRWSEGLDTLTRCGFTGLLTAGGHGNYDDNIDRLDQLCRHVVGKKLQLVAGGGVRYHNVATPSARLSMHGEDALWLHSAALTSGGEDVDEVQLRALLGEL